ncbi:MAG TPA: response regulator [Anaerolineales bacterium]|nr:response regulator [Anaerolineales bacterium]
MKNNKILIADKDHLTENWLSSLLSKEGYDVKTARTGKEFLEKIASEQPSLAIIDPDFPDMKFELVHDVISINPETADIPIIVLSNKDDPKVISALFDKGISDYIVKRPNIENEILGKCVRFFRFNKNKSSLADSGQIISFFSPKGGIGVSTLCLNMAHYLARRVEPKKVLVVDLVLPLGSLALMTGSKQKGSLAQLTTESGSYSTRILDKYISSSLDWKFSILEGSLTPDDALALIPPKVEPLFEALSANYDYLFVEMGKTLSRISIPILEKSDLIVLITGSDPVTVELTQSSLSYLYDIGIAKNNIFVILNRATGREGYSRNEIEEILDIPIEITVPYADTNFNLSTNQNKPYDSVHHSDSITMSLKDLTNKLLDRLEEVEE